MNVSWESISGFAGATGVGALCLLAVFLIFDGQNFRLFNIVEQYAKTTTWSIIAVVPIMAISYVAGVSAIEVAQFFAHITVKLSDFLGNPLHLAVGLQPADLVSFGVEKDSVAVQTYNKLIQDSEILGGSSLALIFLAWGALSEKRNLPGLGNVINRVAALMIVFSFLTFALSIAKTTAAHEVAQTVSKEFKSGESSQ